MGPNRILQRMLKYKPGGRRNVRRPRRRLEEPFRVGDDDDDGLSTY